ncbi:MAG: tetratricopeptide repeat protein [Flavobacteriaceae bacterium]|nr:tetratricopeptide repeat protein [Flavobacteriaceae bacterium]
MEDFFDNELVKKFEEMIENNEEYYFSSEELEDIIIHYLELGDITFAELAANFGLELHPNSIEIKTKKLEVLLELENYTQARILIKELKPSCLENIDFLVCCAKYYSNLGNSKKAIEYCEKALQQEEEENFLHNFIADEYTNLGDPFKALKHYHLALKFDSEDDYALENIMQCYHKLNKSGEAIEFLKSYLDQHPFSETAWFEYGHFFFNKKKYEEAIKGFDYLLAINSQAIGVYGNKAACYEAMGKWQEAIAIYEEQLEVEYTKAFTYYKIGLCYKEMKNWALALKSFQKSLKEDPQFYLSMMEQSDVYLEMGKKEEALYFAKEAIQLNGENLAYYKKLAFLYIDSERFEESLACLSKIVEMEPDRFYNWYAYSEVLMLVGEYEEAITAIERALKIHYRAELYYQLSNSFFHLKNEKKAKEALEIALKLDSSLAEDMSQKYPPINEEVKKERTRKGLF